MTTREWATAVWLIVLLVLCLIPRDVRTSLGRTGKLLLSPKLLIPLLVFIGLILSAVFLAARVGFWDRTLVGTVLFWFIFTGTKLFLNSMDAAAQKGFFRKHAIELIGFSALYELFLNIRTFSLPIEFVLQPVVALLVVLQIVSKSKDEYKPAAKLFGFLLAIITIWLIWSTVENLVDHRHEIEAHDVLALYLVPVWLTITALPYIYLLALYASYEVVFLRMGFTVDEKVLWGTRLGVASSLRGRLQFIHAFTGRWLMRAAEANTFKDARRVCVEFRRARRAETEHPS